MTMMTRLDLFLTFAAFLGAWMLTGWLRGVAIRKQIMDVPNARSSHKVATPRGGGLAVVIAFSLLVLLLAVIGRLGWSVVLGLLAGGAVVAWIGFRDDRSPMPARIRLAAHAVAGLLAVLLIGPVASLPLPGGLLDLGWWAMPVSFIAVIWCINLFNFMDGIDGIAAGEMVCVALGALLVIGLVGPVSWMPLLGLAAACGGYLVWNWPPAKIFMGDAGSGYLGFMVAAMTMLTVAEGLLNAWVWLILFAVFIVDATFTLTRRLIRGEAVWDAHRDHAYQKLARRMGRHGPVTMAVILVNVLWLWPLAAMSGLYPQHGVWLSAVALFPLIITAIILEAGKPGASEPRPQSGV